MAEILIFGRRAGLAAASKSIAIEKHQRSHSVIKRECNKIDSLIKEGDEIPRQLEYELNEIMWDHCGVVREEDSLKEGLNKIVQLKHRMGNIDIRVNSENYSDLVMAFNLKASLITAEATIKSAIKRRESRGSHQRKDHPNTQKNEAVNYLTSLQANGELRIISQPLKTLPEHLNETIKRTQDIDDYSNKLLE